MNDWIDYDGKGMPVPGDTVVAVRFCRKRGNGVVVYYQQVSLASQVDWEKDCDSIVCYKELVK